MPFLPYVIGGAVAIVLGVVGFFSGSAYRAKADKTAVGTAKEEARRILNDAIKNAETKKKELLIEAKDEVFKLRQETEKDLRERRSDVQRSENRLQQKEEALDRKIENLEAKEEKLALKAKEIDAKIEECEVIKRSQIEMLEKISGFSKQQA